MDAVSYAHSAKQAQRIKRFIENPDSESGVLTQPKVIEAGETVTIKSGRQAILADTVVNGDLVIEAGGDVFVPAGAGFNDLDQRIDTKLDKYFSSFTDKPTPDDTDNLALQEVGGDLKKLSFANLKNTLLAYFGVKISSDGFSIKNASGGNIKNQCTAWVNFDGTTTPPTIKDSFNVSDVVRISTGKFRIIIDMDNTNYSIIAGSWYEGVTAEGAFAGLYSGEPKTVSSFGIITTNIGSSLKNFSEVSVQIFGGKD